MQTDIERKSVFMLMPCQTERPATLWHHLLIMRRDRRNALGTNQTMPLLANNGIWQQAEWVLSNWAACACSVWREWGVWMDLFVYWCLCFVFVSQQWSCLDCLQTCFYTSSDKPAGQHDGQLRCRERGKPARGCWGTWDLNKRQIKSIALIISEYNNMC